MPDADTEPFHLPLEEVLEDSQFNARIFFGDIDGLAILLMTEGQREPISVRRDGPHWLVVDGHRRRRAFARCGRLRIESRGERHLVYDGDRQLREAPGAPRADFDARRIRCRMANPALTEAELFAAQVSTDGGKPFTLLERMIFVSRLGRSGALTREQIALGTGFSRTHLSNAQRLYAADPRLLEYIGSGRISQKLGLRLLRSFSPEEQVARICAAGERALRQQRQKILPRDFGWGDGPDAGARPANGPDRLENRLRALDHRLAEAMRFPPNPVARGRLETLERLNRYAAGKEDYAGLEAYLLGRR